MLAACAADPEVIITGTAAGRLWGFHHIGRPDVPMALVAHARSPITRGVLLRRTNLLDDTDRVERDDGIRIASPPRAWFDCARDLGDEHFERLTEWVLDHHTTMPTLWRMASRMSARGRTGAARVNRVLSLRSDWQRPADSGLELRVLKALERRGVNPLVRQYPLRLIDGTVIHLDGAVPELRWAVEIDHVTWHGGRFDTQRGHDEERARQQRHSLRRRARDRRHRVRPAESTPLLRNRILPPTDVAPASATPPRKMRSIRSLSDRIPRHFADVAAASTEGKRRATSTETVSDSADAGPTTTPRTGATSA